MVSLETIKLLESKVTQTVEYVGRVSGENLELREKLSSYQKRIDELEAFIQQFKENQSRIEDGILSALDRLNQFENTIGSKLSREGLLSEQNLPAEEKKSNAQIVPEPSIEKDPTPDKSPSPEGELDIF